MKISLIVPAYNESEGVSQTAEALRPVLRQLREMHEVELLLINDGSTDDTERLLKDAFRDDPDTHVISHTVNCGLGAALRTGFEYATGDVIVTSDFDGTYAFDTIPRLLEQLLTGRVDIVTASPYHPQGKVEGVPRYRLLFSFGASLLYRLLVNWRVYCWTALFRAYRRPVVKNIRFKSSDFLAGTELLVNALRAGYTVSEFPTTLRVRTFGQSSLKIARVTLAHLRFQAQIVRARLAGNTSGAISPVRR